MPGDAMDLDSMSPDDDSWQEFLNLPDAHDDVGAAAINRGESNAQNIRIFPLQSPASQGNQGQGQFGQSQIRQGQNQVQDQTPNTGLQGAFGDNLPLGFNPQLNLSGFGDNFPSGFNPQPNPLQNALVPPPLPPSLLEPAPASGLAPFQYRPQQVFQFGQDQPAQEQTPVAWPAINPDSDEIMRDVGDEDDGGARWQPGPGGQPGPGSGSLFGSGSTDPAHRAFVPTGNPDAFFNVPYYNAPPVDNPYTASVIAHAYSNPDPTVNPAQLDIRANRPANGAAGASQAGSSRPDAPANGQAGASQTGSSRPYPLANVPTVPATNPVANVPVPAQTGDSAGVPLPNNSPDSTDDIFGSVPAADPNAIVTGLAFPDAPVANISSFFAANPPRDAGRSVQPGANASGADIPAAATAAGPATASHNIPSADARPAGASHNRPPADARPAGASHNRPSANAPGPANPSNPANPSPDGKHAE